MDKSNYIIIIIICIIIWHLYFIYNEKLSNVVEGLTNPITPISFSTNSISIIGTFYISITWNGGINTDVYTFLVNNVNVPIANIITKPTVPQTASGNAAVIGPYSLYPINLQINASNQSGYILSSIINIKSATSIAIMNTPSVYQPYKTPSKTPSIPPSKTPSKTPSIPPSKTPSKTPSNTPSNPSIPNPITNITASNITFSTVTLTWSGGDGGSGKYKYSFFDEVNTPIYVIPLSQTPIYTATIPVPEQYIGLSNKKFQLQIVGIINNNVSLGSNSVTASTSITIPAIPLTITPMSNATVSAITSTNFTLSWTGGAKLPSATVFGYTYKFVINGIQNNDYYYYYSTPLNSVILPLQPAMVGASTLVTIHAYSLSTDIIDSINGHAPVYTPIITIPLVTAITSFVSTIPVWSSSTNSYSITLSWGGGTGGTGISMYQFSYSNTIFYASPQLSSPIYTTTLSIPSSYSGQTIPILLEIYSIINGVPSPTAKGSIVNVTFPNAPPSINKTPTTTLAPSTPGVNAPSAITFPTFTYGGSVTAIYSGFMCFSTNSGLVANLIVCWNGGNNATNYTYRINGANVIPENIKIPAVVPQITNSNSVTFTNLQFNIPYVIVVTATNSSGSTSSPSLSANTNSSNMPAYPTYTASTMSGIINNIPPVTTQILLGTFDMRPSTDPAITNGLSWPNLSIPAKLAGYELGTGASAGLLQSIMLSTIDKNNNDITSILDILFYFYAYKYQIKILIIPSNTTFGTFALAGTANSSKNTTFLTNNYSYGSGNYTYDWYKTQGYTITMGNFNIPFGATAAIYNPQSIYSGTYNIYFQVFPATNNTNPTVPDLIGPGGSRSFTSSPSASGITNITTSNVTYSYFTVSWNGGDGGAGILQYNFTLGTTPISPTPNIISNTATTPTTYSAIIMVPTTETGKSNQFTITIKNMVGGISIGTITSSGTVIIPSLPGPSIISNFVQNGTTQSLNNIISFDVQLTGGTGVGINTVYNLSNVDYSINNIGAQNITTTVSPSPPNTSNVKFNIPLSVFQNLYASFDINKLFGSNMTLTIVVSNTGGSQTKTTTISMPAQGITSALLSNQTYTSLSGQSTNYNFVFNLSITGGIGATGYQCTFGSSTFNITTFTPIKNASGVTTSISMTISIPITSTMYGTAQAFTISPLNGTTIGFAYPLTLLLPPEPMSNLSQTTTTLTSSSFSVSWVGGTGATNYTYLFGSSTSANVTIGATTSNSATFTVSNSTMFGTSQSFSLTPVYTINGVTTNGSGQTLTINLPPTPITNVIQSSTILDPSSNFSVSWSGGYMATNYIYLFGGNSTSISLPINPTINSSTNTATFNVTQTNFIGSTQQFQIIAKNATNIPVSSSSISINLAPTPITNVQIPQSSITSSSFTASWTGGNGSTSYKYLFGGSEITARSSSANTASFVVLNTDIGSTNKKFKIIANNASNIAVSSSEIQVQLPPSEITVTIGTITYNSFNVTWLGGEGATVFTYYFNGSSSNITVLNSSTNSSTFMVNMNNINNSGNDFYFTVSNATNTIVTSNHLNIVLPPSPIIINIGLLTYNSFNITWSGGIGGINYKYYFNNSESTITISNSSTNSATFTIVNTSTINKLGNDFYITVSNPTNTIVKSNNLYIILPQLLTPSSNPDSPKLFSPSSPLPTPPTPPQPQEPLPLPITGLTLIDLNSSNFTVRWSGGMYATRLICSLGGISLPDIPYLTNNVTLNVPSRYTMYGTKVSFSITPVNSIGAINSTSIDITIPYPPSPPTSSTPSFQNDIPIYIPPSSSLLSTPGKSNSISDILDNLFVNNGPDTSMDTIINNVTTSLQSQPTTEAISIINNITISSINTYYSIVSETYDSNNKLVAMTSTLNDYGINSLDISMIPTRPNLNIIIPLNIGQSLNLTVPNMPSKVIQRGSLTDSSGKNQTNQISIDDGTTWLSYGDQFKLGNNTYIFSASGSPIVISTLPSGNSKYDDSTSGDSTSDDSSISTGSMIGWILLGIFILGIIGVVIYYILNNKTNKNIRYTNQQPIIEEL